MLVNVLLALFLNNLNKLNMSKIQLKNVRLTFPSIYTTELYEGDDTGKYSATFLIPKTDTEVINKIKASIKNVLQEKKLKLENIDKSKQCFKDGDDTEYDGFAGNYSIKCTKKSEKGRVTLFDRDKSALTEQDDKFYSGCYVNALIDIWCYDKKAKGFSATLYAIQFVKDGERLGGIDVDSEFDNLDGDDGLGDL